jgi:hypothetical protein
MGLAFDNSGNLYVANQGANTIMKFDPSGHASLFASSGMNQPMGLAFDSSGDLYVVNNGNLNHNTIVKFDANGNGSLFASGLLNVGFIAIQIPEPASWVLVALGCAVLLGSRGRLMFSKGRSQAIHGS